MTKTLASGFGWQMHIAAKQRVAAKTVCGPGIPILAMFKNLQKAWSASSAMLPSHTCNRTLPIQAKNCENVEHYDHERGRPRTMSLLFWSFTASHAQQNLLCCFSSSQPTILTFRSVRAYIAILLSIYIESYGTIAQSV